VPQFCLSDGCYRPVMSEFWYRAVVISAGIVSAALMTAALFAD
jgi:hypothetical protein